MGAVLVLISLWFSWNLASMIVEVANQINFLPYICLALSILSLWLKRKLSVWGSLLLLAIALGLYSSRLQWISLISITALGASVYFSYHARALPIKLISRAVLLFLSALLFVHKLPSFSNWLIVNQYVISPNAIPYTLFLNFDKPLIGLFILGFGTLPLLNANSKYLTLCKTALPIALGGIFVICALSVMMGYVRYDLKFNSLFAIWALNNLIFACIPEEVLFRGFIQRHLSEAWKRYPYGDYTALLLASLIFGIAHLRTMQYALLATFAGLVYGIVYQKTKSIEASILTHFLLNTVHFIGFTYPALESSIDKF